MGTRLNGRPWGRERQCIHAGSGVAQYRRRFNVAGRLRVESQSLISNGPELLRSKTSPPHICFACWSLLHSAPADHPVVSANLELGLERSHPFFALSLHCPSTIQQTRPSDHLLAVETSRRSSTLKQLSSIINLSMGSQALLLAASVRSSG